MVILVSLLIALAGLLVYAFTSNPKLQEIGRITYACGMLATLFHMGPAAISMLR